MPTALVGLGVGWMLLNRPSGARPSHTTSYGNGLPTLAPGTYSTRPYGGQAYGLDDTDVSEARGIATTARNAIGGAADQVQHAAGQAVEQVQGTADQIMDQVQDMSGAVVDQVQEQVSQAQSFLHRQMEENPLLVGAVAVAIGGVLATTVRTNPREDQLLGAARDRLIGTAKELTHDTMDKVGRVVDEAQSAAKQEAKEQSLVPEA
jgi:uncharacterized protein YjbJ (UPF0337 family)